MRYILILIMLAGVANAEQSVYSDANFVDPDAIAKRNSREIFILKQKISQLKENIEGLKSIINGQQSEIDRLKSAENNGLTDAVNQLSKRVAALEARPPQIIKVKEEVKAPVQSASVLNNKAEKPLSNEPAKEDKKKDTGISSKELYKKAVLDFTNKRFSSAQSAFKKLLKRGYKKASCNFYLGEIAFNKERYKEAIGYYQASASLNENASYMDKLLLHTGIALQNKGKYSDAKVFLKAVIDTYPGTKSARLAKDRLK